MGYIARKVELVSNTPQMIVGAIEGCRLSLLSSEKSRVSISWPLLSPYRGKQCELFSRPVSNGLTASSHTPIPPCLVGWARNGSLWIPFCSIGQTKNTLNMKFLTFTKIMLAVFCYTFFTICKLDSSSESVSSCL